MGRFSTDTDVYATLGRLLQDVVASGGLGDAARSTQTIVSFELSEPAAEITLVLFPDQEPTVSYGSPTVAASVVLSLTADLAHALFLGDANLLGGINDGRITFTGPAERLLGVWPLVEFAAPPRYRQQLIDQDRTDLLEPVGG